MKLPKKPKLAKPKLSKLPKPQLRRRLKPTEERVSEALKAAPRITDETVAEHREAVLGGARKYIYPLQHSKHSIVRISLWLLATVVVVFFVYCGLALYKFQSTSGFLYGVTRVVPFPVAKAGPSWVSYESYLFELRRNLHYYQTQQQSVFNTKVGKAQLKLIKQQAMAAVIQAAYVKQLAAQYHVSVSPQAVSNEITLVRNQNRLGSSDQVFRSVLSQYWGWTEDDFRRELQQELLQQAVVSKLDTSTNQKAQAALAQLKSGADFAKVATQYSDDASTAGNGGQYPAPITPTDRDIAPQITATLFQMKPGQISGIINTGYTLEILKVIDSSGSSLHAAHIQFTFKDISTYTGPLQAKHKAHQYIHF